MKESAKKNTLDLCLAALFTAIIAVCSQVAIPIPGSVPITLQTFAVALCGYVLSVKWGLASMAAYLILGTVGVPIFAGFKGGAQVLFGMTGGFLFGFLLFILLCGLSHKMKNKPLQILMGFAGLAVCHILGTVQFALVYGTSVPAAFLTASAPYLIKDGISVVAAYFLAATVRRLLAKIHT